MEIDKLKANEVPEDVLIAVNRDLNTIPPVLSLQTESNAKCESDQNTSRFVDVTANDLD